MLLLKVQGQPEKRIIILHTNDLHSRLSGFTPELYYTPLTLRDDSTIGGFARIAGIIKSERVKNEGSTLVFDDGDFFMGTLFPCLESGTGFQLRLMQEMGYDAVGLGNHEFDYGPEWLAGVIRTSAGKGKIPALLSSNLAFNEKDPRDNSLEKLFKDKLITKKLVIERNGIKIGLFSLIGKEAANFAPNAAPVTFEKETSAARRMVRELSEENCGIIICLSHSGLTRDKHGNWSGEDVELARKLKGISLIISGHSHTRLDIPIVVNGVPIVQTGEFGEFVGRLSLLYSGGKCHVEDYRLIPVDDRIPGDKDINQQVEDQKNRISSVILAPLGLSYQKPVAEAGFIIEGNSTANYAVSNLGPLVADAIQYYVNSSSSRGTDVSIIAAGILFDRILPGVQTAADIFRIVPLGSGSDDIPGYPLSRLYITGKELKSVLEILLVAYKSSPDNYCYYSGIRVEYDPERRLLKKIKKIGIVHPDGTIANVDFSRKNKSLYSVTANSYMLEFIGIIKKMTLGLINVVPKDQEGQKIKDMRSTVIDMDEKKAGIQEGKEWLALLRFLGTMKDTDGNGIPDIDNKYAVPVKCFFPESGAR